MSVCSVEGCGKNSTRRKMCTAHYYRWKRNGDPLSGRTENGAPFEFYLTVALTYDGTDCLIWPFSRNGKGYAQMKQGKRHGIVSRLVCEAVHGKPPTPDHEAAHSCGNGSGGCVAKRHLSWKTTSENNLDKIGHGTIVRGEDSPVSKLTEEAVLTIYALRNIKSKVDIAAMFDVSVGAVKDIHSGKNWAWLTQTRAD